MGKAIVKLIIYLVVAILSYIFKEDEAEERNWEDEEKEKTIKNLKKLVADVHAKKETSGKKKNYRVLCLALVESKVKYDERLKILSSLFEIAYESNGVDDEELELLQNIARYLLIQNWDLISLEYQFECRTNQQEKERKTFENKNIYQYKLENAYKVLELPSDCSDIQIKEQFRSLVKRYHPDRLPATLSEKEKEDAVEKFRNIKEAYEYLCEIRNIK